MKRNIFIIVLLFDFILLNEFVFSLFLYKNISFLMIFFSLFYSLVIFIIYKLFKRKYIISIICFLMSFIFICNYIYYNIYSSVLTLDIIFNSLKIVYFGNSILNIIKSNIFAVTIFLIIYLMLLLFIKKVKCNDKLSLKWILITICIYAISMIFVLFDNNDIYSNKRLYFNMNLPDKTLYNYGLMTTIRLDIEKSIFGYFDFGNSVKVNENNYSMDEYNILNTDFKSSDNKYINEINDFLKNSEPSLKNMYTGLFKYKNLIFILAESFNPIAVNKEITPNLFKLFNEGFVFNNFYNPLYPVSTADGQYLSDISLFPSDASHSLEKVNTNYIPYSLGNVFSSMNYKTYSFHDYKYDYYSRDKYYKNMGYETYLASGNGLNEEGYKKDSKMAKYTLPLFIDDEKFLVYYLTVSGHIDYNSNNETATLNYDLVKDLKYSESVKYYLSTQIELDRMIKNIFDELIKKDKLDDTVIVLLPDHVPYGLTNSEMLELSKNNVNDEFDKYLSSMVIYNKSINKYKSTDNYCSNVDILPTLLNLFGVSYDSRLLIGRDILSSINGYAVFGNRNVIGKDFRYISIDNILLGENKNINGSDLKNEVYMKHRVSRLILENDYYRYLFKSNND